MKRVDAAVRRETVYIAGCALVLSAVMEAVFGVIGRWSLSVLLGNVLGAAAAVLNFFLMGLTVQRSLGLDEKAAATRMKLSQRLRMLMLLGVAVLAIAALKVDMAALLLSLLFPRVGIALHPVFFKDKAQRD